MRLFIVENDNSILAELKAETPEITDEQLEIVKPFSAREIESISIHFEPGFTFGEKPLEDLHLYEPHTFKINLV